MLSSPHIFSPRHGIVPIYSVVWPTATDLVHANPGPVAPLCTLTCMADDHMQLLQVTSSRICREIYKGSYWQGVAHSIDGAPIRGPALGNSWPSYYLYDGLKSSANQVVLSPLPVCSHEPDPTIVVLAFHYSEGKWEQLVICVNLHDHQHRTSIFTVQVSATFVNHMATTLEALDGGAEWP